MGALLTSISPAADDLYQWQPVKLGAGGFVTGFVTQPLDAKVRYCRTDVGNAYRWDGREWRPMLVSADGKGVSKKVAAAPAVCGVESVAVDPRDSKVVYLAFNSARAASLDKQYPSIPGSVYKSTDGGQTWTKRNEGLATHHPERVIAHPKDKDTLFCSLDNERMGGGSKDWKPGGIFKSTDAGAHWTPLHDGLRQNVNTNENFTARYKAFAICAGKPEVMYAANHAWFQGGIFSTKDGGAHWSESDGKVEKFYPAAAPGTIMEADPRNPQVAWCLGAEHLLRTGDGGATWQDAGNFSPKETKAGWRGRGFSAMCATRVTFNPAVRGEAMLQALDSGRAWLSRDGLRTWTRYLDQPDAWGGGNDSAFAGARVIYVTTSRGGFTGVWLSSDAGKTWSAQNDGLGMLRGYAIAFNPHDPEQLILGTQGRGFFVTRWPRAFAPAGARAYASTAEDARFAASEP